MSGAPAGAATRSWRLRGPATVSGAVGVPGDKSISHRALLLGAMAHGTTAIHGLLQGEDCRTTMAALRALGVEVAESPDGTLCVHGRGPEAWREPESVLDAGNSGTTGSGAFTSGFGAGFTTGFSAGASALGAASIIA